MGGRTSKIAGTNVVRRYPTRVPQEHPPNPSSQVTTSAGPSSISTGVGPTVHPPAQASFTKSDAIRQDAADPDFASMLKTVGVVQIPDAAKNFDLAGAKNPQLRTLDRRRFLEEQQEEEATNPKTRMKRSVADLGVIHEVLRLRDDKKWEAARIEKELGLADGFVKRLGNHVADISDGRRI
ncbi:hypothetical protein K440DRAFT_646384 [Wilcoxina mikolae CBS 423.85]|nr:hypothetical protein K440DRAFT_646384 [Wilcoxina mikolae CBS 423.85]